MRFSIAAAAVLFSVASSSVLAQGTNIAFGAFTQDTTLPVEVNAESLRVDQSDGTAIFTGNVVIGQGEMRITAGEVRVRYKQSTGAQQGGIERLEASGGVILVSGTEAAESRDAVYTIDSGVIVMTGDVVVTQGQNAMSAGRMTVNLKDGTGVMEGGVKTILQTSGNP